MAKRKNYFLSYVRQGLTTLAEHDKVSGKRMIIPVKLTVKASNRSDNTTRKETVEKDVAIYGPGDVLGIDRDFISRLAPSADTTNFESSLVPFIEFTEPDFLWRFSSRQTADKKNWIPWLTLIVLKTGQEEGEFEKVHDSGDELPPQIRLRSNAVLPDLRESWRWAHVHRIEIEGTTAQQLVNGIKKTPEKAVCRLLCPRRLKPQTRYHAFLVPAFKIGAEAAMGIVSETVDRTLLTWETPPEGAGKIVPYYYDWEFSTGTQGSFEYLVRKLKPGSLKNLGTRLADCSNPGYGMQEEGLELKMEAALKSLDTKYQSWGMDSNDDSPDHTRSKKKQAALAGLLNKREEKIDKGNGVVETKLRVTPPVYGEWYASRQGETIKVKVQNRNHWLEELNLDFRHRFAAGLGVQFVKENQEDLMKAAWEQMSRIKKVNQELNLGRFGREVSAHLYRRLHRMKPSHFFKMAMPVQNKIAFQSDKTVNAILGGSSITNNLTRVKAQKYFYKTSRAEAKADFRPVETSRLVSENYMVNGMKDSVGKTKILSDTSATSDAMMEWPEGLVDKTISSLDPKITIESRFRNRTNHFRNIEKSEMPHSKTEDQLHPVKWHPEFHRPMYRFLREMSLENILPGLENVPENTVGILQTNRRFIEAFMVGLNHEMASELRWREFPTDMRGSYFRSFWDTTIYSVDKKEKNAFRKTAIAKKLLDEIQKKHGGAFDTLPKIEAAYLIANPGETEREIAGAYETAIEKWLLTRDKDKDIGRLVNWKRDNRLGDNPAPGKLNSQEENINRIVLLVKGELLQKFNNTIIYLVKKREDGKPDLDRKAKRTHPVFEGSLPPDAVFIGFPVKKSEAAEYFVIFEERINELRFGLDETPEGTAPGTGISDFSWQHFPSLPPEGYIDGNQPEIFNREWNNAAFISRAMMQKQVRAAVELKLLLPE